MNSWIIALLVILAVYLIGCAGMAYYLREGDSPTKALLIFAWPFTLLWMFFGNVQ